MKRLKSALKVVNLERGMPTVPLALSSLNDALRIARGEGYRAVKIIHGYGSSGEGGAIRTAVQAELMQRVRAGEVRAFIAGEEWRISDEQAVGAAAIASGVEAGFGPGAGEQGNFDRRFLKRSAISN